MWDSLSGWMVDVNKKGNANSNNIMKMKKFIYVYVYGIKYVPKLMLLAKRD